MRHSCTTLELPAHITKPKEVVRAACAQLQLDVPDAPLREQLHVLCRSVAQ